MISLIPMLEYSNIIQNIDVHDDPDVNNNNENSNDMITLPIFFTDD